MRQHLAEDLVQTALTKLYVSWAAPRSPAADVDPELSRALLALPPRMRAAVVFRFVYELDVAQTAAALGCSAGTVKSQTARALDKLRAFLPRPTTPIFPALQQQGAAR